MINPRAGVLASFFALLLKVIVGGLQQLVTDVLNLREVHFQRQRTSHAHGRIKSLEKLHIGRVSSEALGHPFEPHPERVFQSRHVEGYLGTLGIADKISDASKSNCSLPKARRSRVFNTNSAAA